jgi:hypothetical protein
VGLAVKPEHNNKLNSGQIQSWNDIATIRCWMVMIPPRHIFGGLKSSVEKAAYGAYKFIVTDETD